MAVLTMNYSTTGSSPAEPCQSPYSNSIYTAVAVTAAVSHLVSLAANCIALSCIVLFKWWTFFNQRLVLYLSLATVAGNVAGIFGVDYGNSISNEDKMEGNSDNYNLCIFSGFFSQITSWIVLNAYICITASLLLKAFFTIKLEKREILVVLFIYALPLTFNWIPLVDHGYGPSGAWCWIRSQSSCKTFVFGQAMQLVMWYIPLYTILCLLMTAYILVVAKFWRNRKQWIMNLQEESERQQALKHTLSLLMYPVIYFVMNVFPLINRLQGLFNPSNPIPALWFLSGILYPQHGTGLAVAFLISIRDRLHTMNIRAAIDQWIRRVKIKEYPVNYTNELSESYQLYK